MNARESLSVKSKLLILCCAAALFLSACGDDPEPTPTPPAPTAAAAPAAAEDSTPTAVGPSTLAEPAAREAAPAAAATATGDLSALSPEEAAALAAPVCGFDPNADLVGYEGLIERMGCALEDANNDSVAINEFGEGPDYDRFMLWFGGEGQIYVLLPDKSWLAYADTWQDSDPEIGCNPDNVDPATSPPLPRRGFGKLWCTVESVRAAMGTIDREERLCQHSVVQRFEQGKLLACFEDATIRYFRILDDGTWDMEMVQ